MEKAGGGGGGGGGVPVNSRVEAAEGAEVVAEQAAGMDEDGEDADEGGVRVRRMRMRVRSLCLSRSRVGVKWQYRPMRIRMLSSCLSRVYSSPSVLGKPSLHYHRSVLALWRVG